MKYVIIGFGAAAASAAEEIRKNDNSGEIIVVGNEPYNFYSRLLLQNLLANQLQTDNIFIKKEDFYQQNNIQIIKNTNVISIDPFNNSIKTDTSGDITYDKLLIATGARAITIPEEFKYNGIFNLYSLDDVNNIKNYLPQITSASILGAGYVGLDWTKSLRNLNIPTNLLVRSNGVFSRFLPPEGYSIIEKKLEEKGVTIKRNIEIQDYLFDNDKLTGIQTPNEVIKSDMLGLGIGIIRNIDMAKESGINTNEGVLVDKFLQTNITNIYAAGDVVELLDSFTNKNILLGTWTSAIQSGKIAGKNMTGNTETFSYIPDQTLIVFDIAFTKVGYDASLIEGITNKIEHNDNEFKMLCYKDDKLIGAAFVGTNASTYANNTLQEIRQNLTIKD